MDRSRLQSMVIGHRAAAERARSVREEPPSPEEALAIGLQLWDLHPELFDVPKDAVRERDEAAVRAAWARLRSTLRRRGSS